MIYSAIINHFAYRYMLQSFLFSLLFSQPCWSQGESKQKITLAFTATHLSSTLAERMVQLSREGQVDVIDLTVNLDDALYALDAQMVDGVFWSSHLPIDQVLHIEDIAKLTYHDPQLLYQRALKESQGEKQNKKIEHILIASSTAHWVSKASALSRELSLDRLSNMIEGKISEWADGRPFILYLRTIPDPLEMAWRSKFPRLEEAFQYARKQQKWMLIEDEERLRTKLKQQQSICSLSDKANLTLFGLPVWEIQIKDQSNQRLENPTIYYYFSYSPESLLDTSKSKDLKNWLQFIKGKDYSVIQDFGFTLPSIDQH